MRKLVSQEMQDKWSVLVRYIYSKYCMLVFQCKQWGYSFQKLENIKLDLNILIYILVDGMCKALGNFETTGKLFSTLWSGVGLAN